jgi:hypothetical protein
VLSRSVGWLAGFYHRNSAWLWQPGLVALCWIAALFASPLAAVAVALTLAALWPLAWRLTRQLRRVMVTKPWGATLEGSLALVAFGVLGWICLGFVVKEHIPVDRGDHHIMIARAELLTNALRQGHIAHWTHYFQGGDTLTDLYPVFLNWVTALLHLASPSGTAFVDSYSRLCIAAWSFRGFAAFVIARRFASPLPAAALATASLFDVGSEVSDGTWHGVFYWGMIHNNLALSLGLLAVAFQIDLTRRITAVRFARCALLFTIASVAHPLGMLFCLVSVAALTGATVIGARRWRRPLWALCASALGISMAGFWLSPYVRALAVHGFNGSVPGIDYTELGRGMFNGAAPISSYGAWIGFAFVALCCSLGSRKLPRLAMGLLGVSFLLLALSPFLVQSRVLEFFKSFLDAQERRCLTVAKVALIPSLAWLLQHLLRGLSRRRPRNFPRPLLGRALIIGLMLFGPGRALARGFDSLVADLRQQFPVPAESKSGARENDTDDTYRSVYAWIAKQRKADHSPTPWRMTFFDRWDARMHVHWTWVQGVATGVPLVDFGWMSADFIRYRPRELTPQGMIDWNIRYAVGVGRPDVAGFSRKHEIGPYRIFEFDDYDDHFVVAPAGVEISGLKVTEQRIEFDVRGAPNPVDLTVRCAWFPRWGAVQAGKSLPVRAVAPHPGALPGQEQIGVRASNGHVVIESNLAMPGYWTGVGVSLLGLVGTAFAMRRKSRASLESRLLRLREIARASRRRVAHLVMGRRPRVWGAAAAVVLVLVGVALLSPGTRLLIQPAVEGIGMQARAIDADGGPVDCLPLPLHGRITCGKDTSVEAAFGVTPPSDQSGEFGKFWPGLRAKLRGGTSLTLKFPRVDARSGKLRLLSSLVAGSATLVVHTSKGDTAPLRLTGNQVQLIHLPAGLSRSGPLELRISGTGGGLDAILRGELLP